MTIAELEGRIFAVDLIMGTLLALFLGEMLDVDEAIKAMRLQLDGRRSELRPEVYKELVRYFDTITKSAGEAAKAATKKRRKPGRYSYN